MSRTRKQLRQALGYLLGDYWVGTLTAAGSTTVAKSDALKNKFVEWISENAYFLGTSGTNLNAERRITDFIPEEGQIELAYALAAATALDDTYEIHRMFTPSEKHEALNRARLKCFPLLRQDIEDDRLTVGDISSNGDFSKWTATTEPDDWTRTNCNALKETTIVWKSGASCKLTASAALATLKQNLITTTPYPYLKLDTKSLTFYAWVYCDIANEARIGIEHPSGTISYSDYHTGSKQWEKLYVTVTISDPEIINLVLAIASDTVVAYFDHAYAYTNYNIYEYDLTDMGLIGDPSAVMVEDDDENPYSPFTPLQDWSVSPANKLRFSVLPNRGYKMRVIGQKYLSSVSADTDTMEIDEDGEDLLCCAAAIELFKMRRGKVGIFNVAEIDKSIMYWSMEEGKAKRKYYARHPLPPVELNFPTPM